jgi:hypothetical protein
VVTVALDRIKLIYRYTVKHADQAIGSRAKRYILLRKDGPGLRTPAHYTLPTRSVILGNARGLVFVRNVVKNLFAAVYFGSLRRMIENIHYCSQPHIRWEMKSFIWNVTDWPYTLLSSFRFTFYWFLFLYFYFLFNCALMKLESYCCFVQSDARWNLSGSFTFWDVVRCLETWVSLRIDAIFLQIIKQFLYVVALLRHVSVPIVLWDIWVLA